MRDIFMRIARLFVIAAIAAAALVVVLLAVTRKRTQDGMRGPGSVLELPSTSPNSSSERHTGQPVTGTTPSQQHVASAVPPGTGSDAGVSKSDGAVTKEERFGRAETLIGFSLGDSVGATREGLEAAAAEIEELLREGYPDRASSYLLLAQAYNALAFMPGDEATRARYRPKEAEAYRQLSKLEPNEPKWSLEYAMALDDVGARLDALLQTIAKAPHYSMARLIAGKLQVKRGDVDGGVKNLVLAAQDFSSEEAQAHGNDVVGTLNRLGRKEDAKAVEEILSRRGQ